MLNTSRRTNRCAHLISGRLTLATKPPRDDGPSQEKDVANDETSTAHFHQRRGSRSHMAPGQFYDAVDDQAEGGADEHVELKDDGPLQLVVQFRVADASTVIY